MKNLKGMLVFGFLLGLFGCKSSIPSQEVVGEMFPAVEGKALSGEVVQIPGDMKGEPVLLFVGYKQMSQFDIDRWLLGMQQAGVKVKVYELPTIGGIFPMMFGGMIDEGMRSGIPKDDWAIVVTIYDDAKQVEEFLGNSPGLPARVVLLDETGKVVYFHDKGYSVQSLNELQKALGEVK